MEKVLKLKEKRTNLINQARELVDRADKEKRSLHADEEQQYDRMEADISALSKDIQREERLSGLEKELEQRDHVHSKPNPNEQRNFGNPRETEEYRSAFFQAIRQGKNSLDADQVRHLMNKEVRALASSSDVAGGYLVPDEFEKQLIKELEAQNVMRSLATVIQTSNGTTEIPVETDYGTAFWTGESDPYTESDSTFGQKTMNAYKLTALTKVSEELLNDSAFNINNYIRSTFAKRIGKAEESAFINGDGVGKPTGVVQSALEGKVGATGQTTSVTANDLIDLFHSVDRPYRNKSTFLLNDATAKAIRKLKDQEGQYIWQPGLQAGQPDRLLGRPVVISDDMPTMSANAKSILFGDFNHYWIGDRQGRVMQRLDELYATSGQVGFKMFQRTDGILTLPEAIKYYQNSAS